MAAALAFIVVASIACLAPAQSDTFWQLRAGQDFFRTGDVTLVETYSHTATGRPWPNHEWLWQVGAYGLVRLGGFPLLTLGNALMAVGAMLLAFRMTDGSPRPRILLLLLSLPLVAYSWALRPHVVSLFLLMLLTWLLTRERYWWIPAIFLLWANLHGGVALGGVVMITATGFAAALWLRDRSASTSRRFRTLALVTILSGLATLVNPLGLELWTYTITSFTRAQATNVAEWASSLHLGTVEVGFWLWAGMFVIASITRGRGLRGWRDQLLLVLAIVLLPLAFASVRSIAPFALVSLSAMIALTQKADGEAAAADDRRLGHTVAAIGFGLGAASVVALLWHTPHPMLGWRPVPEQVADAVAECPGPLYNRYDEGGYLVYVTPETPVFVDSRWDPYPQDFLRVHQETESVGAYQDVFDQWDIECAALPPVSPTAQALIRDGWLVAAEPVDWLVLYPPVPPDGASAVANDQ